VQIPEWNYCIFNTSAVKDFCYGDAYSRDLVTSKGSLLKDLEAKKEEQELCEDT